MLCIEGTYQCPSSTKVLLASETIFFNDRVENCVAHLAISTQEAEERHFARTGQKILQHPHIFSGQIVDVVERRDG